jgi:hypothetical protein
MKKDYGFSVGDYVRHRTTPRYCWAKILEIIPPHKGKNVHGYKIARCEWTVGKGDAIGLIKYFRLSDLIRDTQAIDTQEEAT